MWRKNITFQKLFLVAGALSFISLLAVLGSRGFLPPLVPLFYGKPTGADQLAPTLFLLIIPAVSLLITIINLFINSRSKDDFIKKFLAVSSLVFSIMTIIAVTKIILLVGFF